jgi:predicted transposase/invertase (TIGR01784 family)
VAVNTLSGISKSREEQIRYISRLKFQTDWSHSISTAEKKGFTEGILQTALNALSMGFTPEQVAGITNLPLSEIENLQHTDSD